jgi:hypothetical protein
MACTQFANAARKRLLSCFFSIIDGASYGDAGAGLRCPAVMANFNHNMMPIDQRMQMQR